MKIKMFDVPQVKTGLTVAKGDILGLHHPETTEYIYVYVDELWALSNVLLVALDPTDDVEFSGILVPMSEYKVFGEVDNG